MYYSQRLVISGDFFELYKYDTIQKRDYQKQKIPRARDPEQMELDFDTVNKQKEKTMFSINRTRTLIRRIINSNKDFNKFLTLTFKDNVTDIEYANRIFSKFIMRLKYRNPNLKYLAVIEFQKRGAIHYHMVSNLPFITFEHLNKLWPFGSAKINKIDHVTNLGAYVCKYLQKDMFDNRMFGQKKYFCSRNCIKPAEIFDDEIIKHILEEHFIEEDGPVYKAEFDNKYTGHVEYNQYKLNNTKFLK